MICCYVIFVIAAAICCCTSAFRILEEVHLFQDELHMLFTLFFRVLRYRGLGSSDFRTVCPSHTRMLPFNSISAQAALGLMAPSCGASCSGGIALHHAGLSVTLKAGLSISICLKAGPGLPLGLG